MSGGVRQRGGLRNCRRRVGQTPLERQGGTGGPSKVGAVDRGYEGG